MDYWNCQEVGGSYQVESRALQSWWIRVKIENIASFCEPCNNKNEPTVA